MGYSVNVVREIWNDNIGSKVVVGPDSDGLNLVQIRVYNCDGKIEDTIILGIEEARLVAAAIADCADELRKSK